VRSSSRRSNDDGVAPAIFVRRTTRCRCSEIAHRSRHCVTIDSRSDPTSSRCQISRRPYRADGSMAVAHNVLLRTSESSAGGARRNRTDDLLLAKQALSQLSYGPSRHQGSEASIREERARRCRYLIPEVVGLGRFELPTSRLSSARSNQLSYKPLGQETIISRRKLATARRFDCGVGRRTSDP
jgi:hypothetical protein